jgi:hypothetical protein
MTTTRADMLNAAWAILPVLDELDDILRTVGALRVAAWNADRGLHAMHDLHDATDRLRGEALATIGHAQATPALYTRDTPGA